MKNAADKNIIIRPYRGVLDLHKILGFGGIVIFLFSVVNGELIESVLSPRILILMYGASFGMSFCSLMKEGKIRFQTHTLTWGAGLGSLCLFFVILHNYMIGQQNYNLTIRWLFYFSMFYIIASMPADWYETILKITGFFCGINAAFVYFFLAVPSLYPFMIRLYGFFPGGTDEGASGFRAGIAPQHSENALIISVGVVILVSFWMVEKSLRRKMLLVILFLLAETAILLTTKRGNLIYPLAAVMATAFLISERNKLQSFVRIIIAGGLVIALLLALSQVIPFIGQTLARFTTIGQDQESRTRLKMWALALRTFKDHPLFGMGWGGYRYQFNRYLYDTEVRDAMYVYLNAHNVYLQLLAETGIVGTALFMIGGLGLAGHSVIMAARFKRTGKLKAPVVYAVIIQLYFFIYSLSDNCLYDIMFAFYVIALGIAVGMTDRGPMIFQGVSS